MVFTPKYVTRERGGKFLTSFFSLEKYERHSTGAYPERHYAGVGVHECRNSPLPLPQEACP